MGRKRTGTTYVLRGKWVMAIRLADKRGPLMDVPPPPDGGPITEEYAKELVLLLQQGYDRGDWKLGDEIVNALRGKIASSRPAPIVASTPAENLPSTTPPPTSRTMLDLARDFVATRDYESAPKEMAVVERYIAPSPFGSMEVKAINLGAILAFLSWLRQRPSQRGGTLAPRTVRNTYDVVQRSLDFGVRSEWIASNPCVHLKKSERPKILDKNSRARKGYCFPKASIVALITDPRVREDRRVLYALLFLTGCRAGEAAVLRWEDLAESEGVLQRLTISRAKKSVSKIEGETKTNSVRNIPVLPALARILGLWRKIGWAPFMRRPPEPGDLIVPNQLGLPRDINRSNRDLGRDCARLSIERHHQHAARHSFIRHLLSDGADREAVMRMTHTPRTTAFDGYADGRGEWELACEAILKLKIDLPVDDEPDTQGSPRGTPSDGDGDRSDTERQERLALQQPTTPARRPEPSRPARRAPPSPPDSNATHIATSAADALASLLDYEGFSVGARGFEPPTPWSRTRCATRLRYAP